MMQTQNYPTSSFEYIPPANDPDQESQLDLLVRLYEGAIAFLNKAIKACESSEIDQFKYFIQRGRRIIEEFQNTLDFTEGGLVPTQLNDLYEYMLDSLTQATLTHDTLFVERVNEQLEVLLDGWRGLQQPSH
ncbi:MAG: flagellar export chaperone FliS [Magnetococcus sp. DMHC-6]